MSQCRAGYRTGLLIALTLISHTCVVQCADWPSFRHDNYRSGKTPESLDATGLVSQWTYQSSTPPQTAWYGPAKWDAYAKVRNLKSMRNYDPVFHPIVIGDSVYFGSSVDDAVHCLDAKSGKQRWQFTTDGPVRIAPTYHKGKLYFGSDDGQAYCIDAKTGKRIWTFRPKEPGRLIVNNGRMIPLWPIRTGVLVDDGVAYFSAGMLPWKDSYLCAVSAETGKVEGDGHFVKKLSNVTIEGPMLCSLTRLVAPQGRIPPLLFDRKTGNKTGQLSNGGGVFVMITADDHILHGPGNKTGWITDSNVKTGAKLAAFPGANAMIVHGNVAYVLTDRTLAAVDRSKKRILWKQDGNFPHDLILAKDTLFAGGKDSVAAFDAKTGRALASLKVNGRAYGIVAANRALFVSTDEGEIRCFRPDKVEAKPKKEKNLVKAEPTPLNPVLKVDDKRLLGRWVFHRNLYKDGRVKNLNGLPDAVVRNGPKFERIRFIDAMKMDGARTWVEVSNNHSKVAIPTKQVTAAAWLRVDRPLSWGGIVGAIQDNGNYERGWLLGYSGNRFTMAVSTTGRTKLSYLPSKTGFTSGKWYHVAGTYDGQNLKIYVNGKLENSTTAWKGDISYPESAPYVIGAYKDVNEFFPLTGAIHEVRTYDTALSTKEIAKQFNEKAFLSTGGNTSPSGAELLTGPYVQFTGPDTAVVRYRTADPSPTKLTWKEDGEKIHKVEEEKKRTEHAVKLTGLGTKRVYDYTIEFLQAGKPVQSKAFELDTFFNYSVQPIDAKLSPYPQNQWNDVYAKSVKRILNMSGQTKGIALVYGGEEGQLAYELAKQSEFCVIVVESDARKVADIRKKMQVANCYGSRVSVHHVESLEKLPFTSEFANLVVSDTLLKTGELPGSVKEIERVLRPAGGTAVLGQLQDKKNKVTTRDFADRIVTGFPTFGGGNDKSIWLKFVRPKLHDAGEWSHLYGLPDNSAFGNENLNGAKGSNDLEVQWIGRPGPRANPDRNGRKPSPLATNGRLFVQGLQRLISLDAYNGTVLWSLEVPPLGRFNMPRDCSNWCADDDYIYTAIHDKVWRIDAKTGKVAKRYTTLAGPRDWKYDWGYLARVGKQLIGSSVKKGTSHTNFWGGSGSGWYDARGGEVTYQVCSDNLFSMDLEDASRKWEYRGGVLLNPTITIGNGKVYFVECRHPKVLQSDKRRVGMPELWQQQFLVALDVNTGKKVWERPLDTVNGSVVFYLAHKQDKLVLVSSQKRYHVYAFADKTGQPLWTREFNWQNGDHGGHMSRPALVADKVFVRPRVLDAKSGNLLPQTMPRGGCGTYACSRQSVIFRAGQVTMWDFDKGKVTNWNRLRPDCWLSTIPANGLLLSPEGGGGCSCGSWMETSIAFRPKSRK